MLKVNTNSQPIKRKVTYMIKRPVNVQLFSTKRYSHKIQALPFKLPREEVNRIVNAFSCIEQHFFYSVFIAMKNRLLNKTSKIKDSVTSMEVHKAYIPLWFYDMAISADVTPCMKSKNKSFPEIVTGLDMGPPRQVLGIGLDCFWPGHTWDPICYLNCTEIAKDYSKSFVPFTPTLYKNSDVEVIPFTVNPFNDLSDRVPKALENFQISSSSFHKGTYKLNDVQVLFHAVYPIYWPVYIVKFMDKGKKEGDQPTTIVLGADNAGPLPFFKWIPNQSGINQWKYNNNNWIKFGVTEPDWYRGFRKRDVPMEQLCQLYSTQVIGKFQTKQVNWGDDRIISYTGYQRQNKDYLHQLYKVWAKQSVLSRMKTMFGDDYVSIQGEVIDETRYATVSELRKEIISGLGNDLKELKQSEPAWYRKYKNKSSSSSK